jgi:hypothetical protein
MKRSLCLLGSLVFVACSGSSGTGEQADSGASPDGFTLSDASRKPDAPAKSDAGGGGGGPDSQGGTDGTTKNPEAGTPWLAGNPMGSCTAGIPANGNPADTSKPTTVVGTGTPLSCTFAALQSAVATGGIITFDCGSAPLTIPVTATLNLPTDKDTIIDGGRKITLDGQSSVEILRWDSPGYRTDGNTLTVQHLAFINAKTDPKDAIPKAPAPCSQGFDDGEGGAIYVRDGNLIVIDSIFTKNQAAPLGPDTGGGAIYINGSMNGVLVVGCTFENNSASNAGAVGALNAELDIYNSLVSGNTATGNGANNNDPTMCSAINNGQNEIGSGGNGGALYGDGDTFNIVVCGDDIENNAAGMGAFGGGIFFTSDDFSGTLSITDSTVTGNTGGSWTNVKSGSVTNAGTAVGTNAKSITIMNSTVQGYP